MKRYYLILFVILFGCKQGFFDTGDAEMLARVYNNYLYTSDIEGIVPEGTNPEDSIMIVRNFINKWIEEQLLIHDAEEYLTTDQKNFREQLENYRNSLLIFKYESYLIHKYLDTLVREDEIFRYYEENKQNFELKENIVKVHYVILDKAPPKNNPFKRLLLSNDPADKEQLDAYCKKNAFEYYLDDEWIPFSDLIRILPVEPYNQTIYLQNNKFVELDNTPFYYFIRFLDYKIQESVSPLSFETENIRNIIINKRKVELIDKIRKEMLQQAMNNNRFEIF